ncbi:helix-turn-helix domain-containing protein [Streptomyces sp. NPDC012794]|uniref:helix-turn-helix domain-containing protein n=1 Tax=Streptomyces sp. NPDC012794 TaxID=3364850 RepID=UPI00367D47E0
MPKELPQWVLDARRVVADRVRCARIDAGWTQERLVEISGVDRSTLQRLEAGTHDTRISALLMVAHALRVPAKDFLP